MIVTRALTGMIKARARALGFDRVAIGPADPPTHGPALERWLAAGHHATMAWMERRREERLDPRRVLPGARSVVCVAMNYYQGEPTDLSWAPVARYAWGRDYHHVMGGRLASLRRFLEESAGGRSREYVDTGPVLERDLAARAGLGWIGKNTMLLHPELGSWLLLGVVLTTAELEPDEALPDRCGSCRACLDACPTDAFVGPYVLDARRCISYLTIEHRGAHEAATDESRRRGMGDWQFGCDACQEACPWNRRAPVTQESAFFPTGPHPPPEHLLGMDDETIRRRFAGSALLRARPTGLRRNAATALANRSVGGAAPRERGRPGD